MHNERKKDFLHLEILLYRHGVYTLKQGKKETNTQHVLATSNKWVAA